MISIKDITEEVIRDCESLHIDHLCDFDTIKEFMKFDFKKQTYLRHIYSKFDRSKAIEASRIIKNKKIANNYSATETVTPLIKDTEKWCFCIHCKVSFISPNSYRPHCRTKSKHEMRRKLVHFRTSSTLKLVSKLYYCKCCDSSYETFSKLSRHITTKHREVCTSNHSPIWMSSLEWLKSGQPIHNGRFKYKLLEENLLQYECEVCKISDWRGEELILRLDHVNGDRSNYNFNNLRLLCPNCDSQTEYYCGRNKGRYKESPPN